MALAHKHLEFDPVPWRAHERGRIAKSGGSTVPVLVAGDRWIRESWDIATYLERTYSDRPALFAGEGDRAKARFLDEWTTRVVQPLVARIVIPSQFPLLAAADQEYYGERTLAKFGATVDEMSALADRAAEKLEDVLRPLEATLSETPFLGGAESTYGDYVVFGAFQWARVASRRRIFGEGSAIANWVESLLQAFGGVAAAQPPRDHWPD